MQQNIRKRVMALALPVVLSSLLQRTVGIVDIFLVGGLGASAIAAVGLAQVMVFFVLSLSWGINTGATVFVAQFWGGSRRDEAAQVASQAMILVVLASAAVTLGGTLYGERVAGLLGADREVQLLLAEYVGIIFACILFTFAINVLSGIMHGAGDTRTPLAATIVVNILHIIVAYPLIYGTFGVPALGVRGAAIAVAVSECMGTLYLFVRSLRRRYLVVSPRIDTRLITIMLRIGWPVTVERMMQHAGTMAFTKIVLLYGTAVYAAYQVGLSIEAFSFMPGYGVSVAAVTLVGQHLGAGRSEDARISAGEAYRIAVLLMAGMGVIFFFFPYLLLRLFTSDPEVIRYGILYMKIVAFAQAPLAATMVLGGSLRGAGDTGFILFATIAGMWLVRIPAAAIIALVFSAPIAIVWSVMILDWIARMSLLTWRYRRTVWGRLEI